MNPKEIKRLAITETRRHTEPPDLSFEVGLAQLEQIIIGYNRQPNIGLPNDKALSLLQEIEHNREFMLALIFNEDHTQVTAIPLPEVFRNDQRIGISFQSPSAVNIESVRRNVMRAINIQPTDSHDVLPGVIILAKNLGTKRKTEPFVLGYWNSREAIHDTRLSLYNVWIRQVMTEMDNTPLVPTL